MLLPIMVETCPPCAHCLHTRVLTASICLARFGWNFHHDCFPPLMDLEPAHRKRLKLSKDEVEDKCKLNFATKVRC